MVLRRDEAYGAADSVLRARRPTRANALAALAAIPGLRAELDAIESGVMDAARQVGATWAEISDALGLRSRQAAEQRRLRLGAAAGVLDPSAARVGRGQPRVDRSSTRAVSALRHGAANLAAALDRLPSSPSIRLAVSTLDLAGPAEPGALVDLVRLALTDLRASQLDPPATELVEWLATKVERGGLK